jgi:steroid delta-isomerase-like uncharacterized protein
MTDSATDMTAEFEERYRMGRQRSGPGHPSPEGAGMGASTGRRSRLTVEDNKGLVRRFFEEIFNLFRAAFPDLRFTVEDLFGEGSKVAARYAFRGTHRSTFRGVAPTGKRITGTGIAVFRLTDGKIAEVWAQWDQLGLLQ